MKEYERRLYGKTVWLVCRSDCGWIVCVFYPNTWFRYVCVGTTDMEDDVNLYKFYWDCGRSGRLEGMFAATEEEIKELIGTEVYFGEVLGKHSEIYGTVDEGDITLVTDDQDFVQKAIDYGMLPSGYSPYDYIKEEE